MRTVHAAHRRAVALAVIATAGSLLVAAGLLESIGEPPAWRIDVLWAHEHRAAIRAIVASIAVAIGGLAACIALRGGRLPALAAWAAFLVLLLARHAEQAGLILDVAGPRLVR